MKDLDTYIKSDKPWIYFGGYGFEERAISVLKTLKDKVNFEYAFSIGFPSSFLGSTLHWTKNKLFIDDTLSKISKNYNVVGTTIKHPVEVRQYLRKIIETLNIDLKNYKIIIDITSFPKSTLFMLLKELIESDCSGYLFYIEPIDYELPISFGVKDVRTLPFFGDNYDTKKQKLLIEILGYEGLRAFAIWETFDPHKTIALIGIQADGNEERKNICIRENEILLSRPNVEQKIICFTDIKDNSILLEQIYTDNGSKFNIIVSSLGTKISTIPLFYFANRHKNVFVAFSRAEEYTEHYSYGCKTMALMDFNKESANILDIINLIAS
jgi:hypothetical protein